MKTKKSRRLKGSLANVAKTMGRWQPQDDYLLIQSVLQLSSMPEVLKLTKFSRKFTLQELEERWYAVLYDAPISKMIYKNLKKLHYDDITRLKWKAPFSLTEDKVLLNLESTLDDTNVATFEKVLLDNRAHFHEGRTSESLKTRWQLMRKLHLLRDQASDLQDEAKRLISVNQKESSEKMSDVVKMPFSQVESSLPDDSTILEHVQLDKSLEKAMSKCYNDLLKQIKRSEAELFLWQILIDKVTGKQNPFLNMKTRAVLFIGDQLFTMDKNEILIGRQSSESNDSSVQVVDVDLSKMTTSASQQGSVKKISRNQCKIRVVPAHQPSDNTRTLNFYLYNDGKLPICVDGKMILSKNKTQLYDKSFVEIGDMSFLFFVNINLIAQLNVKSNFHV